MFSKKFSICAALIGLAASQAHADLVITSVFDGPLPGGLPKGIELYVTEDIADLSIYGVDSANNGAISPGEDFTFPSVTAAAGQYIYLATESTEFTNYFGFAPDYTDSSAVSINGDDAIVLFENGIVVDRFGVEGEDGTGQPWEYLDGWAYRLDGTARNDVFTLDQWTLSGRNALDGETSNASAATPIPVGTYSAGTGGEPTPASIIINEVDADTPSTDTLEFIELFDGGAGNTSLDGLSIVLYNGSDDASYRVFDLDGFTTNAGGYFVLGNSALTEADLNIGTSNIIQNGADAVALVVGDAVDFPNDTPISTENVIDAIVYDTNDADDAALLVLINAGQPQVNEGAGAGSATESNQRCGNGEGGALNTDTYIQALPTPGTTNNCPEPPPPVSLRLISEIQGDPSTYGTNSFGDTDVSPLFGAQVVVEAIVVGDFQNGDTDDSRELNGFYLQEEASDEDANPLSSEGIFVFDSGFGVDVNVGDLVRVTATVGQFFGESQLNNVTAVEVLQAGTAESLSLVNPAVIDLLSITETTASQSGVAQPDLESFEGMLVVMSGTLQITEQFQLDRFNEIRLVAGERPFQFTQLNAPDVTGFASHLLSIGARTITYDDGLNAQNQSINNLDGFSIYSEASAPRMADTVTNLSGVLDYKWAGNSASGATWRVRSHVDGTNTFTSTFDGNSPNPRPDAAPTVEGTLKIASFNVLNFFTTLDNGSTNTAVGLSPRGADDLTRFGVEPATFEFDRQLSKLVNAIVELDADILGLIEIENQFDAINDGSTAIEFLVNTINANLGGTVYDYVYPGQEFVGTDAIAVAFIYKPSVAELSSGSNVAVLNDSVAATLDAFASHDFDADPIFDGVATNRNSLASTFTHIESGESVTLVVNHFKSKGPSGLTDTTSPNFDQLDGAGFWNDRRTNASIAVDEWIKTNPTGVAEEKVAILGDLNAYAQEDPIQYLLGEGYNNVESNEAYSFVFSGQIGTLDYVLVNNALLDALTEAKVWHINADEADALDYNADFGRDTGYFDGTTATRNSDHDPLLVGLNFVYAQTTFGDLLDAYLEALYAGELMGTSRYPLFRWIQEIRFAHLLSLATYFSEYKEGQLSCNITRKVIRFSDSGNRQAKLKGSGLESFNALAQKTFADAGCK